MHSGEPWGPGLSDVLAGKEELSVFIMWFLTTLPS